MGQGSMGLAGLLGQQQQNPVFRGYGPGDGEQYHPDQNYNVGLGPQQPQQPTLQDQVMPGAMTLPATQQDPTLIQTPQNSIALGLLGARAANFGGQQQPPLFQHETFHGPIGQSTVMGQGSGPNGLGPVYQQPDSNSLGTGISGYTSEGFVN